MFPFYHQECMKSSEDIAAIIVSHLSHLQAYFREYYPELENSHLNWIRNPFAAGVGAHLDMKSQEELTDISNWGYENKVLSSSIARVLDLLKN